MASRRETVRHIADAIEALYGRREAVAIARSAVMAAEGITLSYLVAHADETCGIADTERITSELAAGRPLQYVTGHCEFRGMDFEVGEGVLIPRPETEELVEAVINRASDGAAVLDLCTGSGCIAITVAKEVEGSRVTAVDISQRALDYARKNSLRAGVAVDFLAGDILHGGVDMLPDGRFDIVVSNPPYVPMSDIVSMHTNVKDYEPHKALFVDDRQPLVFYEAIAIIARRLLREGGWLCLEIYERFGDRISDLLRHEGFKDIAVLNDANLKPRIVCCRK
ncbi:MAG: peptide chain release factor N(5)-glutamine methyltransferase [Alistipes sp.]|nr:peptide chain release factor N(5)-glutamine methyltransferase [Alistipes sp.]